MRHIVAAGVCAVVLSWSVADAASCRPQALSGAKAWARNTELFRNWMTNYGAHDDMARWHWRRTVVIDGTRTVLRYGLTHMGNGTLEIANLSLRAWRDHRGEGYTYEPYAMEVDLRRDCSLVVSGRIVELDPDDGDVELGRHRVRLTYEFDPLTRRYRRGGGGSPLDWQQVEPTAEWK
jgi:hypothetical protein